MTTSDYAVHARARWSPHFLSACLLLAALLAPPTLGQEFPGRPIRFMIPLAPGGGADITVRAVAQKLSAIWGQTVVVDNRPGGTGAIALETAARAQPDGYTIIMISGNIAATEQFYVQRIGADDFMKKPFPPFGIQRRTQIVEEKCRLAP